MLNLFGDDPGLEKMLAVEEPLVRVGVGVVEGETEYRLGNRRRPEQNSGTNSWRQFNKFQGKIQ